MKDVKKSCWRLHTSTSKSYKNVRGKFYPGLFIWIQSITSVVGITDFFFTCYLDSFAIFPNIAASYNFQLKLVFGNILRRVYLKIIHRKQFIPMLWDFCKDLVSMSICLRHATLKYSVQSQESQEYILFANKKEHEENFAFGWVWKKKYM